MPLSAARLVGRVLGYAAYLLLRRYREASWTHLRMAFGPELSSQTCRHVARGAFINLGKSVMEWLVFARYRPATVRKLVDVQGLGHLRKALEPGRGVIALSAHFGNWELLAMAFGSLGFPGTVLARRLRYPEYEQFLRDLRARFGIDTLERSALKDVVRQLRSGRIVGLMPDQDIDSLEGVFVDFFDQPTYTPVGPAALSLMTGAPIVPCFIVRLGRRFRVMIEEPISAPQTGNRQQDLIAMTQAWSRVVESYLRRCPDHWVWMHRRWKTQPPAGGAPLSAPRPRTVASTLALSAVCGLLAGALVGCAKSGPPAGASKSAASSSEPDQEMGGFTMVGYAPDGAKRWELQGTGAQSDGTIVTINHPDAIGYQVGQDLDPNTGESRTAYLTANFAQVYQADHRIRMEQDVTIHTSDGLWLSSPMLYWLPDLEALSTDQPARLETDHMLLRGRGATGHTRLNIAVFSRDVEMILNPSANEGAEDRRHVRITCDGPLAFDYERSVATFEHNVHVEDPKGDVYSDKLVAYLDRATRTINFAEASGHVRIVQGPHTANGERAIYEPGKGKVTLLGAPSLLVYPDADTAERSDLPMTGMADSHPLSPRDSATHN